MIQPITKDQWDDWKAHPVTEKLFKYYNDLRMLSTNLIDTESRKVPLTHEQIMESSITRVVNIEKEDNFRNMANLTHEVINDFYRVEEEKDEQDRDTADSG